jgi:chemotaxis protein MotB
MPLGRRRSREINVWPGFVDALTSLIIAIVFVLLIFTIAQFTLSEALSGRDEALKQLNRRISELAEMLSLERKTNADLQLSISQLSAELQSSVLKRDTLAGRLSEITAERDKLSEQLAAIKGTAQGAASEAESLKTQLADALKALQAEKGSADEKARELAQLEQEIAILKSLREDLESKLEQSQQSVTTEKQVSSEAQRQVDLLNRQLLALRDQLSQIEQALEVAEQANKNKDVQIADLGKRLNLALAGKVEELARYRSEFFGKLRQILGERPDIRIVGDRFVFQSEVLFPIGSADIQADGAAKLRQLAATLKQITPEIPKDIFWILEIDGYTDKRPISTARYPSNWELSTARAVAVVKLLVQEGIPAEHLAAAGYGEFQSVEQGQNEQAYAKNRRIELKLTQR